MIERGQKQGEPIPSCSSTDADISINERAWYPRRNGFIGARRVKGIRTVDDPTTNTIERRLTLKQRNFIDEYLANGGNGTRAAQIAGYEGNNHTLSSVAAENLTKPAIITQIETHLAAKGVTRDAVIATLAEIMFLPIESFRDNKGHLDVSARVRAAELAGRELGMFREKIDVSREEVVRVLEYIKPTGMD